LISLISREWYTIAIFGMVVLASILPIGGHPAEVFSIATNLAIALLFFLQGTRLSRKVVIAGMTHWRLHLFVLITTFVVFPVLGFIILALPNLMTPALATGILFLCVLPSTVQSSIAFTSIAEGNVPAAICSASASNILGMFLTPLLVGLLFHTRGSGGFSLEALEGILLQLLAPFILGQIVQPYLGKWLGRHKKLTQIVDRGSILMVVYGAFSEAVIEGLWHKLSATDLIAVVVVDIVLLAVVLCFTLYVSGWTGFNREDRITITFCGSKKSLASGAPMANVIFAGQDVGSIVLPLMIFHQIQLMVCAVLARRFASRWKDRCRTVQAGASSNTAAHLK
jgi:sodium/bile acid cotransporter 7